MSTEPKQERVDPCYLCDDWRVVGKCLHCGKTYCARDANRLDQRYCAECMSEITIEDTTFTKTTTEYDEERDSTRIENHTCRDIRFSGIDWMFAQTRVTQMTDTEMSHELEYHRAMVHFLESELTSSSIKKYRMKVQNDLDGKHAKRAAQIQKIVETRTRKVVKVTKEFDVQAFAAQLAKLGITAQIIEGKK